MSSTAQAQLLTELEQLPPTTNPFLFLTGYIQPGIPRRRLWLIVMLVICGVAWLASLAASIVSLHIRRTKRKERWIVKKARSSFGMLLIPNMNLIWPITQIIFVGCLELAIGVILYTQFTHKLVQHGDVLISLLIVPIYIGSALQSWNCVTVMLQTFSSNDFLDRRNSTSSRHRAWIAPIINAVFIIGVITAVPVLILTFAIVQEIWNNRTLSTISSLDGSLAKLAETWTGGLPLAQLLPLAPTFNKLESEIAQVRLWVVRWLITLMCSSVCLFFAWTPAAIMQTMTLRRQIAQLKATEEATARIESQPVAQNTTNASWPKSLTRKRPNMSSDPGKHLQCLESVLRNILLASSAMTAGILATIPLAALALHHAKEDSDKAVIDNVIVILSIIIVIWTITVLPIDLALVYRSILSHRLDQANGSRSVNVISELKGATHEKEKRTPAIEIVLERSTTVVVEKQEDVMETIADKPAVHY